MSAGIPVNGKFLDCKNVCHPNTPKPIALPFVADRTVFSKNLIFLARSINSCNAPSRNHVATSGSYEIFDVNVVGIGGATVTYSGTTILISGQENTGIAIVSGVVGGLGISATASGGSVVIAQNSQGVGNVNLSYVGPTAVYSGITGPSSSVIVSGTPGDDYGAGSLWFDTNEGRLFVYASGNGIASPAWYQTNAEALAYKSEQPPSGAGFNAPPRDGSLWFNNLLGSLFVYDAVTSGWYETSSVRTPAYGAAAPAPVTEGVTWIDSTVPQLKVWNGTAWVDA